jgi:DNA repair protein RadC
MQNTGDDYRAGIQEVFDRAGHGRQGNIGAALALPVTDRPREHLFRSGPEALSDQELLAILLRTGVRGKHVIQLAAELLEVLETRKEIPEIADLVRLAGMGRTKAAGVVAMLEFGRRRWGGRGKKVRGPDDIYALVRHYAGRKQERFIAVSLNGAHEVIAVRVVTVGLVNRTIVHPREVFADPLADRSCAVICAHNHPSGIAEPSHEDDEVTGSLLMAGAVVGIKLLDHLIFTETDWFSYRRAGKLSLLAGEKSR